MRLNLNVTQKRFAFQSDNQHLHTKAAAAALTDQQLFKQKLCNVKEWMREDLNPLVSVKCSTFILPSITSHLSTHSLHCCCYLRHLMCRFPFFQLRLRRAIKYQSFLGLNVELLSSDDAKKLIVPENPIKRVSTVVLHVSCFQSFSRVMEEVIQATLNCFTLTKPVSDYSIFPYFQSIFDMVTAKLLMLTFHHLMLFMLAHNFFYILFVDCDLCTHCEWEGKWW